jgi:hypothetical protein
MDYHAMSLVELKQVAKAQRIKQYYIMKRAQLIQLLSLPELPMSFKIEKMTIHQLRQEAKRRGVRGFWIAPRERLVELLFPEYYEGNSGETAPHKNQKNQGNADKHDEPEKHHAKEVGVEEIHHARDDGAENVNLQA